MKCPICKIGRMEFGETTVTLKRGGATIVFEHVPARVCDQCGEDYVEESIACELWRSQVRQKSRAFGWRFERFRRP